MALSDCAKCWETPCVCGHDYQTWPAEKLQEVYSAIHAEITRREGSEPLARELADIKEELRQVYADDVRYSSTTRGQLESQLNLSRRNIETLAHLWRERQWMRDLDARSPFQEGYLHGLMDAISIIDRKILE